MWQGWIAFLDGLWIAFSSFDWHYQTNVNLIVSGVILALFGFWAEESTNGIILGFLGIWLISSGCTHYLVLPINFFLTGLTILVIAFLLVTSNKRSQLRHQF